MEVDAIVNAADSNLQMNDGVSAAIFKAAGISQLQAACKKLTPIEPYKAVVTPGYNLPSKYIIHTSCSAYTGSSMIDGLNLRACYLNALTLAVESQCKSIAFPLLPNNIYGYPKGDALGVAIWAVRDFFDRKEMIKFKDAIDVYLTLFDRTSSFVGTQLLIAVSKYVSSHFVIASFGQGPVEKECKFSLIEQLDKVVNNLSESFSQSLLHLINVKGKTYSEVYKRANIDRRLFSKIKNGKGYLPSKKTILALAVALELSIVETNELLKQAGFVLANNQKLDVIVTYFIINGRYDIFEINEVLNYYNEPILGE